MADYPPTETWTICDECQESRQHVRIVKEPDGGVWILCDGCCAAIEDMVGDLIA